MYNTLAHLTELNREGRKLCFYPSCGAELLSPLISLKSDVFVLSDFRAKDIADRRKFWKEITQEFARNGVPLTLHKATKTSRVAVSGNKWIFLLFLDNNDVRRMIRSSGWTIAQFIGIEDGCREGGNYECVHEDPFLDNLLSNIDDGADYFMDHSDPLTHPYTMWHVMTHRRMEFKTHFVHKSGTQLFLTKIIIRRDTPNPWADPSLAPYEIFQPFQNDEARRPNKWLTICQEAASELTKLVPFRRLGAHGIIGHYHVSKHRRRHSK